MVTAPDADAMPPPPRRRADEAQQTLKVFLVAGEHSGDSLGGKLMAQLNARMPGRIRYFGVGGDEMTKHGLVSQFPMSDLAVMGLSGVVRRLPQLMQRIYRTVDSVIKTEPDVLVVIDNQEFNQQVARRVRKRAPHIPIIGYVSPSVWAWRPGRAKAMTKYIDHLLALLPFEPSVHQRLNGPLCTYVGHPLIERHREIIDIDVAPLVDRLGLKSDVPMLVILPGSRASEIKRLMRPFGQTIARLRERGLAPDLVLPVVPHLRDLIETELTSWPRRPHLVDGDADKFRAFKRANAALAASGTVSLELALAGTPMVVAYQVDALAAKLRFLVSTPSIVLANLVLERNAFPEFIQEDCTAEKLAPAIAALLSNTEALAAQRTALSEIPARMLLPSGTPSERAARIVLATARDGRSKRA